MLAILSFLHEVAHFDDDLSNTQTQQELLTQIVNNEIESDQFATDVLCEIGLKPEDNLEFTKIYNLIQSNKIEEAKKEKKYQLSSLGVTYIEEAHLKSLSDRDIMENQYNKITTDYLLLRDLLSAFWELFPLAGKHQKTLDQIFTTDRVKEITKKIPEILKTITDYKPKFAAIDLAKLANQEMATQTSFQKLLLEFKDDCIEQLIYAHAKEFGFEELL